MNRYEIIKHAVSELNNHNRFESKKQIISQSQLKKTQQTKSQIENFGQYIDRCLMTLDIKNNGGHQDILEKAVKMFSGASIKLVNAIVNSEANEMLNEYLKRLRQCVSLVVEYYHPKSKQMGMDNYVKMAKLENVKLEKTLKTLAQEQKYPKVKEFESQYVQTAAPITRRVNPCDAILLPGDNVMHKVNQVPLDKIEDEILPIRQRRLERLLIENEDNLAHLLRQQEKVQWLRKQIIILNVQSKIIDFRKQLKNNSVGQFFPKVQRREILQVVPRTSEFQIEAISKQRTLISYLDVCYKHDVKNLMRNVSLKEHPFRVLRTLRAILDSLAVDMPLQCQIGYFEFCVYVQGWFRNFEIPYSITRRTSDIELEKIKFILALQDYNLSKLWDVLIFRQLMSNIYDFDEIDFIVRVRALLLKRPQVNYANGSQIVHMITIESCKDTIAGLFRKYPVNVTKMVIEKLSKTQTKVKNEYKVDSAYALRLLIDLYRELKAEKLTSFAAKPVAQASFIELTTLLKSHFDTLKEQNIDQIYFELTSVGLTRPHQIWRHCVERGHFNGHIVSIVVECPRVVSTESIKDCIKQYDKLTPLISNFRKSLWAKGSIALIERQQVLELNNKLWASEISQIFSYFIGIESLIRDDIMTWMQQTVHTHQRDTELESSLLLSLLRSISSKLTIWKKISVKSALQNDYVVASVKKIQRMVRRHLPHCYLHKQVRQDLQRQESNMPQQI